MKQCAALTADGEPEIRLPSVTTYAAKLGLSLQEVVASPALLKAGVRLTAMESTSGAADRLRLWLDSYIARGERDDRSLVVLFREEVT